jgi:hypothetical protein
MELPEQDVSANASAPSIATVAWPGDGTLPPVG